MGETDDEIVQTLADLGSAGADIVTIGQYLRPTERHLPVARWWAPDDFARWKRVGEALGIAHVESSPLTRSSYHARQAADTAEGAGRVAQPVTTPEGPGRAHRAEKTVETPSAAGVGPAGTDPVAVAVGGADRP